jgi:hypothetical protein
MPRSKWDAPGIREVLIRELAGGVSAHELAKRHGTSAQVMVAFAKRWRAQIERRGQETASEFADIWLADKRARLVTLQEQVERIEAALAYLAPALNDDGEYVAPEYGLDTEALVRLTKELRAALRDAAGELGQLPARATLHIDAPTLRVQIDGVDLEKL